MSSLADHGGAATEQVENLLHTQDPAAAAGPGSGSPAKAIPHRPGNGGAHNDKSAATANFGIMDPSISIPKSRDMDRWPFNPESPPQPGSMDDFTFNSNMGLGIGAPHNFTWEMVGLGLEEPLPPQDTIDELYGSIDSRGVLSCASRVC